MEENNEKNDDKRVELKGEFMAAGAGIGMMLGIFLGGPISIVGLSAIGWIVGSIIESRCEKALNRLDGESNHRLLEHKPNS